MDSSQLAAVVITVLIAAVGFMMKGWSSRWESRLAAQDARLDKHAERHGEHDVNHATLANELEHIKTTTNGTAKDVRELLKSNGKRSTG